MISTQTGESWIQRTVGAFDFVGRGAGFAEGSAAGFLVAMYRMTA